ncbi:restriction alleviation protein Lar [Novosphingobium sp. PhB165]|uniref:Lar family restriction alleviation protein n=1 Tax=Novosphingobium sp. PhB165 TaxID=2485105 RepID=UPI001049DACB|nr:Lar family restriction alleviation protein [Novosphingobium sp. PhB165]TCM21528.1 restriction alleviation protein Lar [Novosphingobium sp. PhB165]
MAEEKTGLSVDQIAATRPAPISLKPDATDIRLVLEGTLPRCPFCNGTPSTHTRFFPHSGIYQSIVHCAGCMAEVMVNQRDREEARQDAIAHWTVRAPVQPDDLTAAAQLQRSGLITPEKYNHICENIRARDAVREAMA